MLRSLRASLYPRGRFAIIFPQPCRNWGRAIAWRRRAWLNKKDGCDRTVQRNSSPLLPAIGAYEAEMRAYGFAAVRAALGYTRQAITKNRMERLSSRAWFRLCHAIPPLKRVVGSISNKQERGELALS